jgi:hypothetical protein
MMGGGAHNHRVALEATGADELPTASAIRAVKDAALSGVAAEIANQPWPPAAHAHELLGQAPLIALNLLKGLCPGVRVERLARCLGLDPLDGPEALESLRITDAWPWRAYRAAEGVLKGRTS